MRLDHDIWEGQVPGGAPYRPAGHPSDRPFRHGQNVLLCPPGASAGSASDGGTSSCAFALASRHLRGTGTAFTPLLNVLQKGSLLELFISLDRPTKRTPWIEVSQFSPEDLQ